MTDVSAGRGGVGIRLFVAGGEVVRRTFDQVGDSGRKMWAQIALGDRSANPAIRALSLGVGEVRGKVDDLAGRAGTAGVALGAFGAAGVALAAALGAVAIAATSAFDAMRDAAALTDQADRIGIGTEALQRWRFAADEAGVGTDAFFANLEKLNGSLGAFKLGIGDGRLKPIFEELGITQDQLANVQTADQLMMLLADTLGQVEDRAAQVRLARGLGIEESLPILRLGSERLRELWQEAETLGLVLDEQTIKRLDEADRQMEIAGQQMEVLRTLAVAPLAEALADASTYVAGLAVEFSKIEANVPRWQQMFLALMRSMPGVGAINQVGQWVLGRAVSRAGAAPGGAAPETMSPEDLRSGLRDLAFPGGRPGFQLSGHGSRGGGGGGASRAAAEAERRQRDRERALEQLQRAELEAQRAAMNARYGPGGTEESRTELALANVTIELEAQAAAREALRAQLEKAGALDAAAEARLEELRLAQEENAAARDRAILEEERLELAERRLRQEEVEERDAIAILDIQAQMAGSARERYEIGRRILLAEQALEEKLLRAAVEADRTLSPEDRQRRLAGLARRQAGERSLFDFDEAERLREQFKGYGREVVQAIEDGRIGEYIGDRIKERLLDGALEALFNSIGGGGKSGGGGFLSGLFSLGANLLSGGRSGMSKLPQKLGGKAAGGEARAGVFYGMAEHGPELLLLGGQGQVTSAAETAKMVQSLAGPGGDGGLTVSAVYAPNIRVEGSGPEIDALRRQLAAEQANFRSNVIEAVADARERRIL